MVVAVQQQLVVVVKMSELQVVRGVVMVAVRMWVPQVVRGDVVVMVILMVVVEVVVQ